MAPSSTDVSARAALPPALSERQRACLALAADGLNSGQIGRRLAISARTVDEHLMLACRALGVRTRVQAVARLARFERAATEPGSFSPRGAGAVVPEPGGQA